MGDTLGWQIKAKPLIDATASNSCALLDLKVMKSLLMLSLLKGMETMRVRVEQMRAAMATEVSLKTYFRSGKKLRAANSPRKMSLKAF